MRRAKTDSNQAEIVSKLREIGATVESLHRVGDGVPDLLVGFRGRNYLLEVKTDSGKLNADQQEWHAAWRGQRATVRTFDEAARIIGATE